MKAFSILVIIAFVGLILFFLPMNRRGRPAAARTQCRNNLKQIGLAFHNYHDVYDCFPPAVVSDKDGRSHHSWRSMLMPFLFENEKEFAREYDDLQPWDSPNNSKLHSWISPTYRCPTFDRFHKDNETSSDHINQLSTYVMVRYPGSAARENSCLRIADFKDGLGSTILAVEVRNQAVHWLEPRDITFSELLTELELSKNHTGGFQCVMADGSVRFINENIDHDQLRALITIDGGETVGEF